MPLEIGEMHVIQNVVPGRDNQEVHEGMGVAHVESNLEKEKWKRYFFRKLNHLQIIGGETTPSNHLLANEEVLRSSCFFQFLRKAYLIYAPSSGIIGLDGFPDHEV